MKSFKKLFSILAITAMMAGIMPVANGAGFSDELQGAYDYAYGMGVTTQSSIDSANMYGNLIRSHMAKMMVNYAKEMGKTADASVEVNFSDIADQSAELQDYIEEAAQMGLMGLNSDGSVAAKFNPTGVVTRAQFGTVLSRVLYGDANNGSEPYYKDHLNALKAAGVMNNISNPNANEVRGYVMLMMQRADEATDTLSATCSTPENILACTLGTSVCPAECQTDYSEIVTGNGNVSLSNTSDFIAGTTLPVAAGIKVGSFKLTASSDDVVVNSVVLNAKGVGATSDIDFVTLFSNGQRITKSRAISSEDKAELNFNTPMTIKAGGNEEFDIVITTTAAAGEHYFVINAGNVISNAKDVEGTVTTPMFKTSTTPAGQLTFSADGSLSNVKLGATDSVLAKFKVAANSVEDITLNAITMKRNTSATDICQDEDVKDLSLYINGNKVASADAITSKYVTFKLNSAYKIAKNTTTVRFEVRGTVVGGAGKKVALVIDSDLDISANGSKYRYGALISGRTTVNQQTTIDAGAITLTKVDLANDRIKKNTTNVEFGTMEFKSAGKDVEVSMLKFNIDSATDALAGVFAQIENLEVYDSTNGQTYPLTYVSGNGTKVYSNTDVGLIVKGGTTHKLVLRADTKAAATNGDYTWRMANATADMTITETIDDTAVTDITPNSLTFKKATIELPSLTLSQNALSAAYEAVVGSSDIELLNLNVKAGQVEDLRIRELKFKDRGGSIVDNTLVAGFALYQKNTDGTYTLVKSAGTSQLASEEITFNNMDITVTKNTTATFKLTTTLVKDNTNANDVIRMYVSAYDIEDKDTGNNAYDATADNGVGGATASDGIIAASEAGYTSLSSARTVTARATGSLQVAMDVTDTDINTDTYLTAGTSTKKLAAIKVKANNESIKLKDITITSSIANISSLVNKIYLVDAAGVVLASETNVSQNTTFSSIDLIVPTTTTTWYIKADLNKIGKDFAGILDQTTLTRQVTNIVAEGKDSGTALANGNADGTVEAAEIAWDSDGDGTYDEVGTTTDTVVSKQFGVLAGEIAGVSLLSSQGSNSISLKVGASNIAILKIDAGTWTNTLANGDQSKIQLSKIRVKIDRSSTITANGNITIERIGGNGTTVTSTNSAVSTLDASDSYYSEFAVSGLGADAELSSTAVAYFLIKTDSVGLSSTENESLTVSMPILNGIADAGDTTPLATEANFEWKDNSDATGKAPLRIKGVTSLDGQVARE